METIKPLIMKELIIKLQDDGKFTVESNLSSAEVLGLIELVRVSVLDKIFKPS